jgi:dnd system-associated protein 4
MLNHGKYGKYIIIASALRFSPISILMGSYRVKVAKDKAELVKALTDDDNKEGPFSTYADVLAFAAALGAKRRQRIPVQQAAKREPSPIPTEIFVSRGYDFLFKLLAIVELGDPNIISPTDPNAEAQRGQIFEEYANGGLEVLREELRGAIDYSDKLGLLLIGERFKEDEHGQKEFDLSRFL